MIAHWHVARGTGGTPTVYAAVEYPVSTPPGRITIGGVSYVREDAGGELAEERDGEDDEMRDKAGGERVWRIGCVVGIVVVVIALAAAALLSPSTQQQETRPTPDQLDVISYDAPPWASERITDCWYVQDRSHHYGYWLIKLDGQWLGLPTGEVAEP